MKHQALDLPVRKVLPLTLATALVAAMGLGALASCGSSGAPEEPRDVEPASIEIVAHDDLEAALAEHRGDGMLLNFWAMWCAPCVAEMPELVEVAHEWADRGGKVVGVSYDLMVAGADRNTVEDEVGEFLAERDLSLPVLIYDDDDYDRLNERFELPGQIPVTLAVAADGTIVDRQHGRAGKARFEEMMRKALDG